MDELNKDIELMVERWDKDKLESYGSVLGFSKLLKTDLENGIPDNDDTELRRAQFGVNRVDPPELESWCSMFLSCFKDLSLQVLLISSLISLVLALLYETNDVHSKGTLTNFIDVISIFVAVLIVSIVQTQTNYAQQKAFQEIEQISRKHYVNTIRNGKKMPIESEEVLTGDLICISTGDIMPADGIFVSGSGLKINQSQETGESLDILINHKHPFVIGGSVVHSGIGKFLIVAVGTHSQSGLAMKTINVLNENHERSPLEKQLDKMAHTLTIVGLIGAALTFLTSFFFWFFNLYKYRRINQECILKLVENFMVAVTVFICVVPEGLPLAVTISLGFSMKKMMKDNNFVRHLNACETMGSATTICCDKTGTLTENKLTVDSFFFDENVLSPDDFIRLSLNNKAVNSIVDGIVFNSTAYENPNVPAEYIGPSIEAALLQFIKCKFEIDIEEKRKTKQTFVIREFSSDEKIMSTVVKYENKYRLFIKGAPDRIIPKCTHFLTKMNDLKEPNPLIWINTIDEMGSRCLRSIMLAYKDLGTEMPNDLLNQNIIENDFVALTIISMKDPVRHEVYDAIRKCEEANVVVRMVTGDDLTTAINVAKECGILNEGEIAMKGHDFSNRSKLDLVEDIGRIKVIARASPLDKYRLVSLLKELGEVVAVTGDGSNDAPALKKADIGLSMGLCGTDLAKMASDIVILDDNFYSIVQALKWGRCIYDNVQCFLQFQLTVNISAMIVCIFGTQIFHESPLKPVQLLWINLIMDSLAALALATKGPDDFLLRRPPNGKEASLISPTCLKNIIFQVTYQVIIIFTLMIKPELFISYSRCFFPKVVRSHIFTIFTLCQALNLLNCRHAYDNVSFFAGICENEYFILIFFLIIIVQIIITELAYAAFETVGLTLKEWGVCSAYAFGTLIVGVIQRFIKLSKINNDKYEKDKKDRTEKIKLFYNNKNAAQTWEDSISYTSDLFESMTYTDNNELMSDLQPLIQRDL